MRDLGHVGLFVAGAVGEPGDRTFMLQFEVDGERTSYLLEKGQVAALCEQSRELLETVELAQAGELVASSEPWYPDELEFRIGAMQLAYDPGAVEFTLVLVPTDEDTESVSYRLTPAQLAAAARDGLVAVESGRPPCPRCGLAMDRTGHHCPATNGDLRGYRP